MQFRKNREDRTKKNPKNSLISQLKNVFVVLDFKIHEKVDTVKMKLSSAKPHRARQIPYPDWNSPETYETR